MFYPPIIHSSPNWVFPFFLPLLGFIFTLKLSYNVVQFLEHESRSKAVAVRLLVAFTFKNHDYLNILMLSTQYRKGLHTRHRATFCPIPITSSFVCYSVILFWTEFQFLPPQTKFPKVMFPQVFVCPQVVCIRGGGYASRGYASRRGVLIQEGLHPRGGSASREGLHPWGSAQPPGCRPRPHRILWDTVNKRAVCILLYCILVRPV